MICSLTPPIYDCLWMDSFTSLLNCIREAIQTAVLDFLFSYITSLTTRRMLINTDVIRDLF